MKTKDAAARRWQYDPQTYLGLAALLVLILVTITGTTSTDPLTKVTSSITSIFATFYVSYLISKHFAQEQARHELIRLAEASGSRVFLLSSQIKGLAEDVLNIEPEGESSSIHYESIATQLTRLGDQAELSFEDLKRIANVDISIPQLREQAAIRIEEGARREEIPCPSCSNKMEVLLGATEGASRHVRCDKCGKIFIAHRLHGNVVKLSFSDDFEVQCPNPNCTNRIRVRRGATDFGSTVRNCYECKARITYDFDTDKVVGYTVEEPLHVALNAIKDGRAECPYCAWLVSLKETRNSRNEWLQFCPHCTKLIQVDG